MCKRIGYEFYFEELFVVKSKSKFSCASAIYFNLAAKIIRDFEYYFNKTNIKPSILEGGHEIVLANWPNYKHMVCMVNNDVPANIPSYPYVLLNRMILYICYIEAESSFLIESLAACHDSSSNLVMYFTVNMAFVTYFDSLMDSLDAPILQN